MGHAFSGYLLLWKYYNYSASCNWITFHWIISTRFNDCKKGHCLDNCPQRKIDTEKNEIQELDIQSQAYISKHTFFYFWLPFICGLRCCWERTEEGTGKAEKFPSSLFFEVQGRAGVSSPLLPNPPHPVTKSTLKEREFFFYLDSLLMLRFRRLGVLGP